MAEKKTPIADVDPQSVAQQLGMGKRKSIPLWIYFDDATDEYTAEYPNAIPLVEKDGATIQSDKPGIKVTSGMGKRDAADVATDLLQAILQWHVHTKNPIKWADSIGSPPDECEIHSIALAY